MTAPPQDRRGVCLSRRYEVTQRRITLLAGRKTTFPCGHTGKGKYCHRCAQETARRQETQQQKRDWEQRLQAAPIGLTHLPKGVAKKVLHRLDQLAKGSTAQNLKGKRLTTMGQRDIISIPIGRRYRLICRDTGGSLEPLEALSHESYNNRLAAGGW